MARGHLLASDRAVTLHALPDARAAIDARAIDERLSAMRRVPAPQLAAPLDAWSAGDALVFALEIDAALAASATPLRARGPSLGLATSLEIVATLARALAPLHHAGFVHGMLGVELISLIKPEAGRVRLDGLGVGAVLDAASRARVGGIVLGRCFAPEVVRGEELPPGSDVHALGALLLALVAGEPPYPGLTSVELFAAITRGGAAPLETAPAARAIVSRALASAPRDRFRDAGALADALADVIAELPSSAATTPAPIGRPRVPGVEGVRWDQSEEVPLARPDAGRAKRASTARFAGALAQQQVAVAKRRHGEDVVRRALATLARDAADEIERATPVSWVRVDSFARFHDALAAELGRPVEDTHAELVRGASERTFNTLWRLLLRVGGTRLVMTRAPVVYSKTYDTGVMETQDIGDRGGRFVLRQWPDVPEFVLRGLRAGMTVGLENVGREGVRLESTRTADGAVFTASWER